MINEEIAEAFAALNDDRAFDKDQPFDRASLFLLTALFHGKLHGDEIAGLSPLSLKECREFEGNARRNGIFVGDKIHAEWLEEPVSFFLDTLCVFGIVERTDDPDQLERPHEQTAEHQPEQEPEE